MMVMLMMSVMDSQPQHPRFDHCVLTVPACTRAYYQCTPQHSMLLHTPAYTHVVYVFVFPHTLLHTHAVTHPHYCMIPDTWLYTTCIPPYLYTTPTQAHVSTITLHEALGTVAGCLPRVVPGTLVAKRQELLPLFFLTITDLPEPNARCVWWSVVYGGVLCMVECVLCMVCVCCVMCGFLH